MEDEDGELQRESSSLHHLKENKKEKSENLVNNDKIISLGSTDIVPISPKKQNGDVEVKSVDNLKDNRKKNDENVVGVENKNDNDEESEVTKSNRHLKDQDLLCKHVDVGAASIDKNIILQSQKNLVKINKKSDCGGKVKRHLLKSFTKKIIKREFNSDALPITKKIRKKHDQNVGESGEFSKSLLNNNKKKQMDNEININKKLKKRKLSLEDSCVNSTEGHVEIKGNKKRILHETPFSSQQDSIEIQEQTSETEEKVDSDEGEEQNAQLTEYAQYLGLQPTVKFKCYKCDESGFPTMQALQSHQDTCLKNTKKGNNKPPSIPNLTSDAPSTNIRITRKVYLCSVCGTYYENWNLFLHMREVHRRYICLLCLGMFSEPDNLALHLTNKHGVIESTFSLPEDFFSKYSGSFFLMCCTCDRVFSEDEEFFEHECIPVNRKLKGKSDTPCSLCGIKGNHQPNCRKSPFNIAQQQQNKKESNRKKNVKKANVSESKNNTKEVEKSDGEIVQSSVEIKQSEKADIEEDNYTNSELIDTTMLENIVGTVPEINLQENKNKMDEEIEKFPEKTENESHLKASPQKDPTREEIPIFEPETPSVDDEEEEETLHIDESQTNEEEPKEVSEKENTQQPEEIETKQNEPEETIQIAGEEMAATELIIEEALSAITLPALLKASVKTTAKTCVYCNHAKKIAVNGKQLALHLLAEHRLSPVLQPSGEPAPDDQYITRLKYGLGELQNAFFNSDTYDSTNKELCQPDEKVYECFQCHYVTPTQKDLYLHNRKMHQKTILLCIMCKTNFYSYSELLCHLCPGIYDLEYSTFFRCCVCAVDSLPSAFRLMVHLRKRHHACDVCLEITEDQQKLSNHVWKHKLHHLCYRCGIAYRNKPDITKHLFWKHGTESVLCKKCLQKKWPHVYHFCIPPNVFVCEECNATFTRAVALKVHKRIHVNDMPYSCTECNERFISKKLLARHEEKHRPPKTPPPVEPPPIIEEKDEETTNKSPEHTQEESSLKEPEVSEDKLLPTAEEKEPEKKSKVDVYDLPPLNLSSESDDSEDEAPKKSISDQNSSRQDENEIETKEHLTNGEKVFEEAEPEPEQPAQIIEGIWDNFKNYKANLERRESQNGPPLFDPPEPAPSTLPYPLCNMNMSEVMAIIINDHDYIGRPGIGPMTNIEETPDSEQVKLDESISFNEYKSEEPIKEEVQDSEKVITPIERSLTPQDQLSLRKKSKSPKKRTKRSASSSSSDSSSNSDSSSCSCGTNCSCSSSSSSSTASSSESSDSDSSSSEGRRRQQERRERRRERAKRRQEEEDQQQSQQHHQNQLPEPETIPQLPHNPEEEQVNISLEEQEAPIRESELDTDETETDEDFYDKHPQMANKTLAEKRNKLLLLAAAVNPPINNGALTTPEAQTVTTPPPTSTLPETPVPASTLPVVTNKRKYRSKKRRRGQPSKNKHPDLIQSPNADYQNEEANSVTQAYLNSQALAMAAAAAANPTPTPVQPPPPQPALEPIQSAGSSSENDTGKRLSKRKRVPKRFYGDSSDEEGDKSSQSTTIPIGPPPITTSIKWRKVVGVTSPNPVVPVLPPPPLPPPPPPPPPSAPVQESYSESSSDEGSDSESDTASAPISQLQQPPPADPPPLQKNESLYCYCQCPYDEVSEMIACDGKDCTIEWFHFECVGIMVPPKGKWFCPDCRKRSGSTAHHTHY